MAVRAHCEHSMGSHCVDFIRVFTILVVAQGFPASAGESRWRRSRASHYSAMLLPKEKEQNSITRGRFCSWRQAARVSLGQRTEREGAAGKREERGGAERQLYRSTCVCVCVRPLRATDLRVHHRHHHDTARNPSPSPLFSLGVVGRPSTGMSRVSGQSILLLLCKRRWCTWD